MAKKPAKNQRTRAAERQLMKLRPSLRRIILRWHYALSGRR